MRAKRFSPLLFSVCLSATPFAMPAAASGVSEGDIKRLYLDVPPPPVLELPIACEIGPGRDKCHIAFYPDHDPTEGVQDYKCGARTYNIQSKGGNAHTGTDIAVLDSAALTLWKDGAPRVLAAADGVVFATRRGMQDTYQVDPSSSRACGNAVIIQHYDGWFTGYCHMQQGSVQVRSGDVVKAGDVIGRIGLSGNSNFPHLHFYLQHRNEEGEDTIYDPFSGTKLGDARCKLPDSFWSKGAKQQLKYQPVQLVKVGFTDKVPRVSTLVRGQRNKTELIWDDFEPIVGFSYVLGATAGMKMQFAIQAEGGKTLVRGTRVLEKTERVDVSTLSLREAKGFKEYLLRAGKAPLGRLTLYMRVLSPENKVLAAGRAYSTLKVSGQQSAMSSTPFQTTPAD